MFYKKLIHGVPLKNVTSHFAMEKIKSITGAADVGPDGRVNTGPFAGRDAPRGQAELIVGFARPNILLHDESRSTRTIESAYSRTGLGTKAEEKSHSDGDAVDIGKVARDPFCLGDHFGKVLENMTFLMVGAPGLEPGTR